MNFLTLTTPLVDLVDLWRRWRIPALLIDLMTVIYRFIFVLIDIAGRMRMAQESRLGYNTSFYRAMNSAGLLAGYRAYVDGALVADGIVDPTDREQLLLARGGWAPDLPIADGPAWRGARLKRRLRNGRQRRWSRIQEHRLVVGARQVGVAG